MISSLKEFGLVLKNLILWREQLFPSNAVLLGNGRQIVFSLSDLP